MPPEKIVSTVCADAQRIGIELEDKIRAWRLFVSPDDFYFPYPGSEALRPAQRTPVRGLTLAGDYTKQLYMATMEGAVLSGKIAADLVLNRTAFPGQTYLCTYTLPAQRRKIPRSHLLRFTARALHWMMSKPSFQCSRPLRNSYILICHVRRCQRKKMPSGKTKLIWARCGSSEVIWPLAVLSQPTGIARLAVTLRAEICGACCQHDRPGQPFSLGWLSHYGKHSALIENFSVYRIHINDDDTIAIPSVRRQSLNHTG